MRVLLKLYVAKFSELRPPLRVPWPKTAPPLTLKQFRRKDKGKSFTANIVWDMACREASQPATEQERQSSELWFIIHNFDKVAEPVPKRKMHTSCHAFNQGRVICNKLVAAICRAEVSGWASISPWQGHASQWKTEDIYGLKSQRLLRFPPHTTMVE